MQIFQFFINKSQQNFLENLVLNKNFPDYRSYLNIVNNMANDLAVRSSLPLQVLLYLNQWYLVFWLIVEALCFVFKGQILPFARDVLGGEIALFIILFLVDLFRIYFATKGNLTERNIGVLVSIIVSVPCIGGRLFIIHTKLIINNFFINK